MSSNQKSDIEKTKEFCRVQALARKWDVSFSAAKLIEQLFARVANLERIIMTSDNPNSPTVELRQGGPVQQVFDQTLEH